MPNESQNTPMQKVAYHIDQGAVTMYVVDANAAVANFPGEWSFAPWSAGEASDARAARASAHAKATEDAKAAGRPLPAPLPAAPPPPTDAEKTEIDADTKAREEAAALVKAADEKAAKEKEEADKVAAAKALLATPPPVPDPNIRRPLQGAAKANAERKAERDRLAAGGETPAQKAQREASEPEADRQRRLGRQGGETTAAKAQREAFEAETERRRLAALNAPNPNPPLD